MTYGRSYAKFELDENRFELFVLANKTGEPSQEDCAVTLDAARNVVLRTHMYSHSTVLNDEERRRAASLAMSSFARPPADIVRADETKDVGAHLASLATFRATVNKADNILDGVSCTGALSGTDVNVRVRP